jgi:DNA-binding winged helix-turn-helix (wHTH) protein/Tfp pilus assembly protein PilF
MTPPSYVVPASKVLSESLRVFQTSSNTDNSMKVERFFAFGPYQLDCERHLLLRGETPVPLHEKALEILIVLVRHRGEVVSKDELMKAVWPDAFVEEANLSQNVFVLRKALGEHPKENRYIATMPGRGYSFVASLEKPLAANHVGQNAALGCVLDQTLKPRAERKIVSWFRSYVKAQTLAVVFFVIAAAVLVFGYARLFRLARYYNNLGVVNQQRGDLPAAIRDYQWALRFKPDYPEAHYNLADAYEEIPDYVRALDEYQRAIDGDPTFYPAYNNLSRLYILRQKDYVAALRLLDHAVSFPPKEASVQYTLYKNYGWANLELGQLGQAEQNLRFAISLDSQRGSAHCLLAKVLDARGKQREALSEWESCLAYSHQPEVEPEWRNAAQEVLRMQEHPTGERK